MSRGAQADAQAHGLFGGVGNVVVRRPWIVIAVWLGLAVILSMTIPPLTEMATRRPVAILPSDAPVLQTTRQINEAFHQSGSENENVLLVVLTDENGLDSSDLATYRHVADELRPDTGDIVMLQDFIRTPALRDVVTSKDHQSWYMPVVLAGAGGSPELHEAFTRVADTVRHAVAGSTLTANLTGPAATGDDLVYIGVRDMHVIEAAVVLMVLVILFVIYRNPATMALPLLTIGVSVVVAQSVVAGMAVLGMGVTNQTITLMTTMMAGAGIDYAVFIISRYHDYLRLGLDSDQAVFKALTSIGKVIAGSAATVSITFLGMIFTHLGAFQAIGPACAISIAIALLVAVTFLPAVMVLAGRRGWITPRGDRTSRFWRRSGIRIVRRPVLHLVGSLVVLFVLAGSVAFARFNFDDSKTLPNSVESSVGYATLARHFPLNATIPEYLVIQSPKDLRNPAAVFDLKRMEQRVSELPDIAGIHGAPVPRVTSADDNSGGTSHDAAGDPAGGGQKPGESGSDGVDSFPNVASLLFSIGSSGNALPGPDLGIPGMPALGPPPAADVDDTAMFVRTVRALGFAMSVDVADIATTVNAAPVTVVDVVAVTEHDGGALQKINDFAEQLQSVPDANSIEEASQNLRRIVDKASNDLRVTANDGPDREDRSPVPNRDPHTYADAIKQMIDEIKALINQTSHTGGGLSEALTAFISADGHTARYLVQTKLNPYGSPAMDQIHDIVDAARGAHPDATLQDASVSASGVTAMLRDMRAYYYQDIKLIIAMTIVIVFAILVALLRAVVAPLYLIASVVISFLSALGVGVIVFQFILGQELTGSIPGLTFILLVAMGADYNLLLISRLREEAADGLRSGIIRTVRSTGGVITAAGVIFAASMFGMLFASISTLVQAGFIIGVGLLIDTFLVRTITVPAMAALVGQANWWPSKLPPPAPRERPAKPSTPAPGGRHAATTDHAGTPDAVALRT